MNLMIEEGKWGELAVPMPPKPRLVEYATLHPGPKPGAKGKSMKSILRETSAFPDPYALSLECQEEMPPIHLRLTGALS